MLSELRKIPLDGLLIGLGATPSKRDPTYGFDTSVGRLSLDRNDTLKFYNHDAGKGGYGALDLVQMVKGCDFKTAKEYLQGFKPEAIATVKATPIKPKTATPLTPSSSVIAKEQVRNYLVEVRNLDPVLVAELMATGKVFAVENAGYVNVGFRFDDGGGCELRGTTGTFHGCNGKKGPFSVERGDADQAVFVESAIEALSYLALHKQNIKVISTTGSASDTLEALVKRELALGKSVVAGFNNDKAGEVLSAKVLRLSGTRETPKEKDWNDDLKALSKDRER